jgi:phosphatidylinositol alpha-mannosyltransferase
MQQVVKKGDMQITYRLLKTAKIAYWLVRDAFKVLWVTLMLTWVRAWKVPGRSNRRIRQGESLRICIISEYYYPLLGGITEHVYNFARRMLQLGHEVTLITSNAGDDHGRGDLEGLRIFRVGRSKEIYSNGSIARMTFSWRIYREVEKIFAENDFDIVHVHSPITPTLPLLCQRYIRCRAIGTYHTDFDGSAALKFWQKGAQHLLDNYDGIAAVSPVSITSMRRYLDPKGKVRLIPNGVDTGWFHRRDEKLEGLDDGRPNILYIGRFDPRNGFSKMVEAFAMVKDEIEDARLVVVGYGPLQDYYMSKIPEELKKDIVFLGKTDLARPMIYSSSDVICVPAQKAACSVAILEALASATPIVASGIDGFKWIIEHEKEALLVHDMQPRSYADALIRVLRDGELRERLTRNGLRKAYTLDWKVVTEEVLQLYYDVLQAEPVEAEETIEPEERPVEVVPLYPAACMHPTA